jgi:hypothetical protein
VGVWNGCAGRSSIFGYVGLFSPVFPSQLEVMVGGALVRVSTLSVGLGVGGVLIVSGSPTRPSHSCDGWVCDVGVVGDRGLGWGDVDFCFSFRISARAT